MKYIDPRSTYITSWGLSLWEGETPVNLHIRWRRTYEGSRRGFYLYAFGRRVYWFE